MLLKEDASEEKINGRYFTPRAIAEYIVAWILQTENEIERVLEPSCGDGIFLECLLSTPIWGQCKIDAIEIEESIACQAAERINGNSLQHGWRKIRRLDESCRIIVDDFYNAYRKGLIEERYQAIAGNPPYIRYQYLTGAQRDEQSEILTDNGMHSNKMINAWVSFVVACVNVMDTESRIGLVLPAELLQVKYAEDLRRYLVNRLQRLTIVTFENLIFDGIEQEVVLLLGEKTPNLEEHRIRIVQYRDAEDMIVRNDLDMYEFYNADLSGNKWTKYFLNHRQNHLIDAIKNDNRFVKFGSIAKCEVGITTGNNNYFSINRDIVDRYNLEEYCRPLIARSVNIKGIVFTEDDWMENVTRGAKTYLLDLATVDQENFNDGLKEYIELGENKGENKGYKCRIRNEWYKVPSVWSPNAFFLRRNYLYPKFMLNSNDVNAVSTDTMHRVTINDNIDEKLLLLAYYNSVSLAFTEIEGRSYGGGVLEILPGEVSNIMIPNLHELEGMGDEEIGELVDMIDRHVRGNTDILGVLDIIDRRILVEMLGMNMNDVLEMRDAWLTLRSRRLYRGGRED